MSSLYCIFTQDVHSYHTISLHAKHVPTATNLAQVFSKKILKAMENQDPNELGWDPLALFSTIIVSGYPCHYIVLGEIFVVVVCMEGSPILEAERALSHAKMLILETLGGSIKSVTISNILHLANYAQIVLALDELLYNSNLQHIPKREMEWIGQNKLLTGGRHLVAGSLLTGAPIEELKRMNPKLKKTSTRAKLDEAELYTSGMNWQREFRNLKLHEERLQQLNNFDLTFSSEETPVANDDLFDDTWSTPTPLKDKVASTQPEEDRLPSQAYLTVGESPQAMNAGLPSPLNTNIQTDAFSSEQMQKTKTILDAKKNTPRKLDLLSLGNTNSESDSRTFSDEESSTTGSFINSPSISPGLLNDNLSPYSSQSSFSDSSFQQPIQQNDQQAAQQFSQQSDQQPGSHLQSSSKQTTLETLPLTLKFIENLTMLFTQATLTNFQFLGEISVIGLDSCNSFASYKFSLTIPETHNQEVCQFIPNPKVCRPSKDNPLQLNCSISADLLSRRKHIPLLRYKYLLKSHTPIMFQARRQVSENTCKIMIDYAINRNNRPQSTSLRLSLLPEGSNINVQKIQFKPQEYGMYNAESKQLLFNLPTNNPDMNSGKIMIQYILDQNIESIPCNPILVKFSNLTKNMLEHEKIEIRIVGNPTWKPLTSVVDVQREIQGKCKVIYQ